MPETTVTVEAVAGVKTGENAKGKAWKKWSFKGDDGAWYSTFTEGIGSRFVKGETYTLEFTEDNYGRTVKGFKSGDATRSVAQQRQDESDSNRIHGFTSTPGFTGGEKDRSIVRQVAWKAGAELTAAIVPHLLLIPEVDPVDLPGIVFKTASKIAHGIENDIYREQPKPAPQPTASGMDESDIPFMPSIDGAN